MAFRFIISKASKVIFKGLYVSMMALGAISIDGYVLAEEAQYFEKDNFNKFGYHLVRHFWNNVKNQNVRGYSKQIGAQFTGLNTSGEYDRKDQISGLENLILTDFTFQNLKTVRYENTLVIAYDFYAEGEEVTSGPSIDVWNLKDNRWNLISHSYVPFESDELKTKCGCGWKKKNKDRNQ